MGHIFLTTSSTSISSRKQHLLSLSSHFISSHHTKKIFLAVSVGWLVCHEMVDWLCPWVVQVLGSSFFLFHPPPAFPTSCQCVTYFLGLHMMTDKGTAQYHTHVTKHMLKNKFPTQFA